MTWERKYLDKNRGLQHESFMDSLEKAMGKIQKDVEKSPPVVQAELEDYEYQGGIHVHGESNPFGLHTHEKGGTMNGAHTHGPSNREGQHHHRTGIFQMVDVDGSHGHHSGNRKVEDPNGNGKNPDGWHDHSEENIG